MNISKFNLNLILKNSFLKNSLIHSNLTVKNSSLASLKPSKPTRCIFYVPGSDSKKLNKIFSTNADCVVLDCEDGVALNRKKDAREKIRELYDNDSRIHNDFDGKFAVRINSAPSDLALEDINALFDIKIQLLNKHDSSFCLNLLPKTIFVPKTNRAEDIKWLYEKLDIVLKKYKNFTNLSLFFYMESALSLINLNDIIKEAIGLSANKYSSRFCLEGFVFGSDDFVADIGAERTQDASELIYARQKLVAHCKAYKLKAIDMVYINYKDLEGLKIQSEQGQKMGFTGKQVIHPGQIDVTQNAFTPSKSKIEWATGLVEAFNQHQKLGSGAFTYNGQMIDMPSLLQAKNIIAIVEKIKKTT